MPLSEAQPLRVTVYSKAFERLGWVTAAQSVSVQPRWNAIGTASITLPVGHRQVAMLQTPGVRVVIEFDVNWDTGGDPDWRHLLSGPIRGWSGQGDSGTGVITFSCADDFRLFSRVLGWQVPGSAIGSQSGAEYRTVTGAAETVVKTLVTENAVTRMGLPVTVETTAGRGSTITVQTRMHKLYDRLWPSVEAAGVGFTVRQSGSGLLVECRVPTTHPRVLSEASGAVRSWTLTGSAPEATRVITAGPGEGTARPFRRTIDSAVESEWGDVVEVFQDADDADTTAKMDDRAAEALLEGAATTGLSVELADTPGARYARDFIVGDVLTLQIGDATYTDTLREASLSWGSDGFKITPVVGGVENSPERKFARTVRRMARTLGNLTRG